MLANGYKIIYNPLSKHANKYGYMFEHILIAEEKLGRELKDGEVVHHRDLNRVNNNPENLIVFKTKADHTSFHHHNCDEKLLIQLDDQSYIVNYLKCDICPICLCKKDKNAKICINCFKKAGPSNQIITSEILSREKLKKLIRTKSFVEIGKLYGVTDNAIRKWCDKYNLPRTKKEIKKYSDTEWENI